MNNKILIGVIISISILVSVSFTSVIGYNKLDSCLKTSPLFNIRSSRATQKDNQDLSCEYVGKGDDFKPLFPERDENKLSIKRFIDRIQSITDEEFNNYVNLIIHNIQQYNNFNDADFYKLIASLTHIRDKQELNIIGDYNSIPIRLTYLGDFWATGCWFPGCFLFWIIIRYGSGFLIDYGFLLILILALILSGGQFTSDCYVTFGFSCDVTNCC